MLTNYDAIIIDLDGTLVDSVPDLAYALNNTLAKRGHPELAVDVVRNMIGGGIPKLLERGLTAHGADASEEAVSENLPYMLEIYEKNATNNTVLYPGARELLDHLKSRKFPTALCTNKPTEVTHIILKNLEIADCFHCIIGGTSGFPKKPDPASLKHILGELKADPKKTLMVGDSAVDVGAARAAGLPVAIMTYGYSKTPASELKADFVLDRLDEILKPL